MESILTVGLMRLIAVHSLKILILPRSQGAWAEMISFLVLLSNDIVSLSWHHTY